MRIIKYLRLFCSFTICLSSYGQVKSSNIPDSLRGKSYEYILGRIESTQIDSRLQLYIKAYIEKAKAEKNWKVLAHAYNEQLHLSQKSQRMLFADSAVWAARLSKIDDVVGTAYLGKGILYFDMQDPNSALDNYLTALEFLENSSDTYLQQKVKYNIAQIKYYLGYYNDAIILFQENLRYFERVDDLPYLTTLHSLGLCYNRLGYLNLATQTNNLGIKQANEREYYDAIPRFTNAEGINQYFKKNYQLSIAKLEETLPMYISNKDYVGEAITRFYLGKNYLELNFKEKAIGHFLKVDEAFTFKHISYPDLRESFEVLINHYKDKGDLKNQLKYINHLLLVDKYLDTTFRYLSGRIHKEYDTKKLVKAKEEAENALNFQKSQNTILLLMITLLIVCVSYLVYKARQSKRKFKKLIERKAIPKLTIQEKENNASTLNINPVVISSVLKHLDKFESSEKFLSKDLTLPKLAKMFDSNIVYVSKIISHSRQKKSVDYINDLRVEYIMSKLRENSKFRNYTNKALAEEAGFSTTQHFTRAFLKCTGISPSYFIQELKRTITSTT